MIEINRYRRYKIALFFLCIYFFAHSLYATNLLTVYEQAAKSDPTYNAAIATALANQEAVPISIAALLPALTASATAKASADRNTSPYATFGPSVSQAYELKVSVNQPLFDFAKFSAVYRAAATAKQARATLNASVQDLIVRTAKAYFAVLNDQENLRYRQFAKAAYKEQLKQVKYRYRVGLKTLTDIYTAESAYDSAISDVIAADTMIANDRENLRVITGKYLPHLAILRTTYPLTAPEPTNIEQWVKIALKQNWTIKASQYALEVSRQALKQQFAGHLPVLNLEAWYSKNYLKINNNNMGFGIPQTHLNREVDLSLNLPIFSGGGVTAQTQQAFYSYQAAQQNLEQIVRNTINNTRQSYLGMLAGISKIKSDQRAIQSAASSLKGIEASYKAGTETLSNVLIQQQNLLKAQTQYAADRYAYINSLLALQQAAGTLSTETLREINSWLK